MRSSPSFVSALLACILATAAVAIEANPGSVPSAAPPADTAIACDGPLVIDRIAIINGDVIPPWSPEMQADRGRIAQLGYRLANFLHMTTKERVVARELFLAVGDTLDTLDVAETERNLRELPFINEAEVIVVRSDSGRADVHVRTSDNFTLAPGIVFESGGGTTEIGLIVIESSFLGLGKRVAGQYVYTTGSETDSGAVARSTWSASYRDLQFLGTQWELKADVSHAGTDDAASLVAARPFTSVRGRLAGGGAAYWFDGYTDVWRDGNYVLGLPRRREYANAWFSRAWGPPALRLVATPAVSWDRARTTGPPHIVRTPLPGETASISRSAFEATATIGPDAFGGYHTRMRLDDFGIVEDIEAGWRLGLTGGLGVPSEPTTRIYGVTGASVGWVRVAGPAVTAVGGVARMRLGDDIGAGRRTWSNLRTDLFVHHYLQGIPGQTIALSANWEGGWRADPPYQLLLGGDTGLRGYSAYRFSGTRRLLFNAEDRIYTPFRILTLAFGFVAFADAGYVWPADESFDPRDLRADAGLGLRVYNTRAASSRVSRLDVAFRLRGDRGFSLSLGSEQLFDLLNVRPTPTNAN